MHDTPITTGPYAIQCRHCSAPIAEPCLYRGKPKEGYYHVERESAAEREEHCETLRKILPHGSTVYTVLRHVSASGMSRRIDLYTPILDHEGKPGLRYLTGYVANACGLRRHKGDAIIVGGCGMDMGYHLVSNLSYALHGYDSTGQHADHYRSTPARQATPEAFHAGYTLVHEWV